MCKCVRVCVRVCVYTNQPASQRPSPVVGKEAIGQDEPPLLVSLQVIGPLIEPTFHVRVSLLLGHGQWDVNFNPMLTSGPVKMATLVNTASVVLVWADTT